MAKRGGFPGGGMPGNMNNLMKQAQRMQRQMEEKTKEMEEKEWEATAGGGAVTVKISGKKEVLSVKLDPEVVDPDDIEMLEDLIVAATNEALRKVEEESSEMMSALTGGLGGNAVSSSQMASAGIKSRIPVDEVIDAMAYVGDKMDESLKETGVGGLAGTVSGKEIAGRVL